MKFLLFFIFIFSLTVSAKSLNQSFFCKMNDGNVFYLELDMDYNLGLVNDKAKGAKFGKYKYDGDILTLDIEVENIFEKSYEIVGNNTFIYSFKTESLQCHGLKD